MTLPGRRKSRLKPADCLAARGGHVHLAGICGVGMAGLAFLLKARGFRVSGCDLSTGRMAGWLESRGIRVSAGHAAGHIDKSVGWVIRSAAVPVESPELVRAARLGVPVFARGTVLPELIADFTSVAVGGTHGKTTTTTFITQLLLNAGLRPSWCIGGEPGAIGGVAGFCGSSGKEAGAGGAGRGVGRNNVMVVEADESDGTLALYRPDIAVVTNIEFDHMEHFASVSDFEGCFRKFISQAKRRAIYCVEDPRALALCRGAAGCLSYGFRAGADVRGVDVRLTESASVFTVVLGGRRLGRVKLPVPGLHNVLNALAAAAVGLELGLSFGQVKAGLSVVNLPGRRFERVVERAGVLVISDYAHHPSEVRALVRTAGQLGYRRLRAVFQPHRFTRTLALGSEFPPAFEGLDEVVLLPVYAASEAPLKGGTSWDLYGHFRGRGAGGVSVATSMAAAWAYFRRTLRAGDLFLIIGAGDVEKIAGWAREEAGKKWGRDPVLPRVGAGTVVRHDVSLASMTTLGVGGRADVLVNTGSLRDLARLVVWARRKAVPFRVLGAGSNVVVSDLGLRGVTVRLSGGDFGGIREEGGLVVVGAGVPLARLLAWLEERGLSGLEFLDSIPGTVGGAVRMNAGAWGRETGEQISRITCLNTDGAVCTLRGNSAGFGYRECRGLRDRILVDAAFRVVEDAPESIRVRRKEIRQRRAWLSGLRSAGSIFRNPKGDFAGRLIEKAGLKGARTGGAVVSSAHANVIVTEAGASGSDVMCLMEKIRSEVMSEFNVWLETEVVFLE